MKELAKKLNMGEDEILKTHEDKKWVMTLINKGIFSFEIKKEFTEVFGAKAFKEMNDAFCEEMESDFM